MFNIFMPDKLRKEVERISNGRVTVLYDRKSIPSFMAVLPKIRIKDLINYIDKSLDGKFSPFAYSYSERVAKTLFNSIFENTSDANGRYTLDDAHPAFVINNMNGTFDEVSYIYIGLFQSNNTVPHSIPIREIHTGEWIDASSNISYLTKTFFDINTAFARGLLLDQYLKPEYRGISSASYYNSLSSAFKKNVIGSSSWRVMNIWVYSLLRHILYYGKLVGGSDHDGFSIEKYEPVTETEYSAKISSHGIDFDNCICRVVILVPSGEINYFEEFVNSFLSNNRRLIVYGKRGRFLGYVRGIIKENLLYSSTLSNRNLLSFTPYTIILEKSVGKLIDYDYYLNNENINSDNVENIIISYIESGYVIEKRYPVLENSQKYFSKLVDRKFDNYINLSTLYNEYVFDVDSEFYRIFGISDILFSLYSEVSLIDGLFLVPFYVSFNNGLISYSNTNMRSFVPITEEGHLIRYISEDGLNLSKDFYNYSFDKNSTKCTRFNDNWGGENILHMYKRLPVEWVANPEENRIYWEFTKFPDYLPYKKDTYISYINMDYLRNKNWQSLFNNYRLTVYGEGKTYLIGREYVAKEFIADSNTLKISYVANNRRFDFKKYITEFRLFLLSSLVAGYKSLIFEFQKDKEDMFIGKRNIKEKRYYNYGQIDDEVIQVIRYNTQLPRPQGKHNYLYPGEFFLYRGSSSISYGYAGAVSGVEKNWNEANPFKRAISLYNNSFTQVDLFNYKLIYIPGI